MMFAGLVESSVLCRFLLVVSAHLVEEDGIFRIAKLIGKVWMGQTGKVSIWVMFDGGIPL